MSSTQLPSGAGKTSARLFRHHFAVCRSSLATLTQLLIGLVIMALIVIGLTNPSGAQASGPRTESATSLTQRHDGFPALFCSLSPRHASVCSSNVGPIFPSGGNNLRSDRQVTNATRTVEDCFGLSTPRYYGQRRQNSNSNLTDLCSAVSAQGVPYDPHTTDDI
jgi:hypothetical protein